VPYLAGELHPEGENTAEDGFGGHQHRTSAVVL
jgi:hypothetical protein